MKNLLILLFVLILSNSTFSQNLKGRITDKSGEPLYGSTIYIRGINQGLVCNEAGYYQTTLPAGNYVVGYKCLSYKKTERQVSIAGDNIVTIDIVLEENPFNLKEVSVSNNEDPAYAIIRKAIEKAPFYADCVKGYTADVYIKGNAELLKIASLFEKLAKKSEGVQLSDFKNQVFVQESFNEIQFTAPDKYKQTVKAFSSSIPDNLDSKDAMGIMNSSIYRPKFGSYISPLNPKAFSYYKFRYEGFSEEGDQIINKIKVEAKLKDPLLLNGYIYIADNSWHVHSSELTASGYGVKQTNNISFQKLEEGVYLPIGYIIASELDLFGTQIRFNYYASLKYTSFEINEDIVKKLSAEKKKQKREFEIKKDTLYTRVSDSLATKRDSLYWNNIRVVPLEKREIVSYINKDSVQQRLDSLRKEHHNPKFSISDIFMGGRIGNDSSRMTIKYEGVLRGVPEYNFVDGVWLGQRFRITNKLGKHNELETSPYLYYVTARKRWLGGGDIRLNYAPMLLGRLNISLGSISTDFNPLGVERAGNAYSSLVRGENLIYFYQKDFISINNRIDIANGLKLITGLEIAKRSGLSNNTDYTWGRRSRIRENPYSGDRFDQTAYNIGIDYTPYAYYSVTDGAKKYERFASPTFFVRYTEAFSSWQTNNSQFRKLRGGIFQQFKVGYFNNFYYLAEGGGFIGSKRKIHFADFQHFSTSNTPVNLRSPFHSFLLIDGYEILTNRYWVRTELHYTSQYILLKRLPFLQGKMFTESLHLKNLYTPEMESYTEAGYSVNLTPLINGGIFASFQNQKYRSWGFRLSCDLEMARSIFK